MFCYKSILVLLTIILFAMCKSDNPALDVYKNPNRKDHHSYSNPSEALTTHLDLDIRLDFNRKVISGTAKWDILNDGSDKIIFDTRDLVIKKVEVDGHEADFELSSIDKFLGQSLTIPIKTQSKSVSITYETTPVAPAVQWLSPEQTADKTHPFLFTQGQAILTRTWLPCQDSPGIRISYNAKVTVPDGLMAVMSASNPTKMSDDGVYSFEMKQKIPPYLIALAVGNLKFGSVGKRTGVYAEPSMLDASVYEFGEMEQMLESAENLYGPYLWDRYDVIVLPPSFPFGGMENPRLTFATPTIIAGDRSLTALIAHELAHSWSGNLVTNATWDDFWLNEGFTVYFERRIMEAVYGKEYADMLAILGYQDLEADVEDIGEHSHDTHLKLDLKGRDADDGMTDIAYEKGAYFLLMLEQKVGRVKFDEFLRNYFEHHKFKTIATDEFVTYLKSNLLAPNNVEVDLDEWIFGPGIPSNCPKFSTDKFAQVDDEVGKVINSAKGIDIKTAEWNTHQWLHFIRSLPKELEKTKMASLDKAYSFSKSTNSEIAAAWYELSIHNGYYSENVDDIEKFLIKVGRRKFLTPLYRALKENNDLDKAREIYAKAKTNYHSVSTGTMDALLEL